jgi:hypothetical protein
VSAEGPISNAPAMANAAMPRVHQHDCKLLPQGVDTAHCCGGAVPGTADPRRCCRCAAPAQGCCTRLLHTKCCCTRCKALAHPVLLGIVTCWEGLGVACKVQLQADEAAVAPCCRLEQLKVLVNGHRIQYVIHVDACSTAGARQARWAHGNAVPAMLEELACCPAGCRTPAILMYIQQQGQDRQLHGKSMPPGVQPIHEPQLASTYAIIVHCRNCRMSCSSSSCPCCCCQCQWWVLLTAARADAQHWPVPSSYLLLRDDRQAGSPHAAMTLVPFLMPLAVCTTLSVHSMTRSSLAFSRTSLQHSNAGGGQGLGASQVVTTAVVHCCTRWLVAGRL